MSRRFTAIGADRVAGASPVEEQRQRQRRRGSSGSGGSSVRRARPAAGALVSRQLGERPVDLGERPGPSITARGRGEPPIRPR